MACSISSRQGWAFFFSVLAACSNSKTPPDLLTPAAEIPQLRVTSPLMQGWKFKFDDGLSDEEALESPAADWETVDLPHSWNAQDAASLQSEDYRRGLGWYRLEFPTPSAGDRHWLQLGAASLVADVWLNGEKLGQHRGGFTQFRFDVTSRLNPGGNNVLLVKTDNSIRDDYSYPTTIDPLGGDFNKSGGLYREVALVSTPDAVHFTLGDNGGPGVYATTTALDERSATVRVTSKVRSDSESGADYTVRLSLMTAEGQQVATVETTENIPAGSDREVTQELQVSNPRLWQGVEDPHLYRLVADLVKSDASPIDRVIQKIGIRQVRFDPAQGFFLNNRHVPLHGVAIHQDFLGKSWAVSNKDVDTSFALIREVGANAVRLGHYPFSQYTLDKVSELGLVAWSEKPSGLRTVLEPCQETAPRPEFLENAQQQLREMIRQNFNQAGVVLWSIGNETEAGSLSCDTAPDNVRPYLNSLNQLAKDEDPSRPTVLAEFTAYNNFPKRSWNTAGITDVLATNRYYHWYTLDAQWFSPLLEDFRKDHPQQALGISEYGAGGALTHHTDDVLGGPPEVRSAPAGETSFQPEEYQAWVHEQDWSVISSKPYLWGTFVWNMFDFGSARRNEGDVLGVNTKGIVTFDRRTRKDAFYFYQANWANEPVMHIVGGRYTERAYGVTDVRVYSNAHSVTLKVNDAEVGTIPAQQCPQRTCVFSNVALQPGANRVTASGSRGGQPVNHSVDWSWNNPDVNIAAGMLATGYVSNSGARFGSDHFFKGGQGKHYVNVDAGGGVPNDVSNTPDPKLYKFLREGTFSYDIPVSEGAYTVTLGFIEPDLGRAVGERVFSVTANGSPLLTNFDIRKEAGAALRAVSRTFTLPISGGRLVLDFRPTRGDALVSNLTVKRATP